ncbi:uncharacterized protein N0V89_003450 [Didymosphaeria variabile]|uniref:LPXTG-domain-containing protein n=1 Tax=Didymosphaeria variabile TaxID=1932322 RepID=A0A9W9CBI0_9PLEO|nr:uncharacterized protein N0V89_003450 [Didymosphaeria variabile]KAJ4355434.1 hypothetical protein N0V89_003450 [Didymosphaeria variabile]
MIKRHICFVALFLGLVAGLEVGTNSPCAKKCLDDPNKGNPSWSNASTTFGPDVACIDADYVGKNATKVGKKFADCQTCMQSSGWEDSDSGERDTTWFLFNNRGAADYCIFGRFAEESNKDISSTEPYKQCFSACNPIYAASDYRIKSDPERYDYCDSNGNYTDRAQSCIKCLYNGKGLTILGNIVATLTEMCNTKPGKNINFDEAVYNTTQIKLPASTSNTTSTPLPHVSSTSSSSGLSKGAIAGIVLGGLVAIAAVLAGILLLLRRARKRRENKTIEMPGAGPSPAVSNVPYQYAPVQEHKYAHNTEPVAATRPISELPTAGDATPAELGPTSPRYEASELGTGSPVRR